MQKKEVRKDKKVRAVQKTLERVEWKTKEREKDKKDYENERDTRKDKIVGEDEREREAETAGEWKMRHSKRGYESKTKKDGA